MSALGKRDAMDETLGARLKRDKAVGYGLLIAGLAMVIISVYLMSSVFTGGMSPPPIFRMDSIDFQMPSVGEGGQPIEVELIPGDQVSKVVNMSLWSILMVFVASAGSKIGGLGVRLAREVKVEVKRED